MNNNSCDSDLMIRNMSTIYQNFIKLSLYQHNRIIKNHSRTKKMKTNILRACRFIITSHQVNQFVYNLCKRNFLKSYINNYNLMETESCNESIKSDNLIIGTHNGVFHCDEVLACFMLKQLPKYQNAKIIRTRDDTVLNTCNIVVDVGGVFDPATNRFDHHQKTFTETLSSLRPEFGNKYDIRLSSAGLVYTFFGEEVIKVILKNERQFDIDDGCLKEIFRTVYETFIQEIDGIDNGVPMFDGEPKYTINSHLSSRVAQFNPHWNTKETDIDDMKQFGLAMELVGKEFLDKVLYFTFVWWPARSIVKQALDNRFKIHESGEILELTHFCPWKKHLSELEVELEIKILPKYVIFENKPNDWRAICIPNEPTSFVCRKFLHKDWRGLRDDNLAEISGINDIVFCHATGFIGGSKSREGAFKMALQSLEGNYTD